MHPDDVVVRAGKVIQQWFRTQFFKKPPNGCNMGIHKSDHVLRLSFQLRAWCTAYFNIHQDICTFGLNRAWGNEGQYRPWFHYVDWYHGPKNLIDSLALDSVDQNLFGHYEEHLTHMPLAAPLRILHIVRTFLAEVFDNSQTSPLRNQKETPGIATEFDDDDAPTTLTFELLTGDRAEINENDFIHAVASGNFAKLQAAFPDGVLNDDDFIPGEWGIMVAADSDTGPSEGAALGDSDSDWDWGSDWDSDSESDEVAALGDEVAVYRALIAYNATPDLKFVLVVLPEYDDEAPANPGLEAQAAFVDW